MGVTITGTYLGEKRVELTHGPTGSQIITDAPLDNNGRASTFSPTDLLAGSLGACMLTIAAIYAENAGIPLTNMSFSVEKIMTSAPRAVGELIIKIRMPKNLSAEQRTKLERAAMACPVHKSLSTAINFNCSFSYDL
ncbi:MAG: OsmC family protein [bacterium]|nr:OsmC family protein [bacterium]